MLPEVQQLLSCYWHEARTSLCQGLICSPVIILHNLPFCAHFIVNLNYYPIPNRSGDGVLFPIDFFVCFFLIKITRKRLDRFAWNFQGRCGVTVGQPDSIFGQFGETVQCCNANFFVSNITSKPLNRFAWNFQGRCEVTMGWPDYTFGQFRETVRCRDAQHGLGFVVLSHHSLFLVVMCHND